MTRQNALEREHIEREFWETSENERPGAWSMDLLTHKMSEPRVFLEKVKAFRSEFASATRILELGAGQGWASAMLRSEIDSSATVIATDISSAALQSRSRWEGVVGAQIDSVSACNSDAIPLRDGSIDVVFVFAAAHHFANQRNTMREIARVLAPGGVALYFHEPACKGWIYPLAYRRVNAKRPAVPEDVLRLDQLDSFASEAGLDLEIHFAPTTTYRGAIETVYYLALQRLPLLQRVLPCTIDVVMRKR